MSCVWSWFFLRNPVGNNWYIGWGIRFPNDGSHWSQLNQTLSPKVSHGFVTVGKERGFSLPIGELSAADLPTGWMVVGTNELAVGRELSAFRADTEGFATDFANWVVDKIWEVEPTIGKLTDAVSRNRSKASVNQVRVTGAMSGGGRGHRSRLADTL